MAQFLGLPLSAHWAIKNVSFEYLLSSPDKDKIKNDDTPAHDPPDWWGRVHRIGSRSPSRITQHRQSVRCGQANVCRQFSVT
jgi:hypothetical protein